MSSTKILSAFIIILATIASHAQSAAVPSKSDYLKQLFESEIETNFEFKQVSPQNVKFLLYSHQNPIEITPNNSNLIDLSKPTKIIIHGWLANGQLDWVKQIAKNYHQKSDYNVIAVDWSTDAGQSYFQSAQCVRSVGNLVGQFILNLTTSPKQFHLIGHSFGAQASGFAGQYVHEHGHVKIDRITGMDPAGPLFEFPLFRPDDEKLSRDDADFVDVIHTNAGVVGTSQNCGTVDFYVNKGGPSQPDCGDSEIIANIICSHEIAHDYFAKSILRSGEYEGVPCWNSLFYDMGWCDGNGKVTMGDQVSRHGAGTVFLKTV